MRKGMIAAVLSLVILGKPIVADEVIGQMDIGKQHYIEGDYTSAIVELEFALSSLRDKLSALFMATMPEAPVLWTADHAELAGGTALFGGGMMITRLYQEAKGKGEVRVELVVDSPMVQAFSSVLSSPIMIANEPLLERLRLQGTNALLRWDPDKRSGEISLSIGGRVLAKMEGQGLIDKAILIEMMKSWDLDAVRDVAGL